MEYPWVQYQGNSALAKCLAMKLNDFLNRFYTTQAREKIKLREPRGTLLICDRSFDLLSPVLHDYYYQQLVYEFKEVGDEGEVTLEEGKHKMAFLNDQDDLWVRFRNRHIADVHARINQEVSSVVAESKRKMGSGKSTEDMSLTDMAEVIRSNPKYDEMMKKYHIHMELTNKCITEFTQFNLRKLIVLE